MLWIEEQFEALGWDKQKVQNNRKAFLKRIRKLPESRKACGEIYRITSQLYRIFTSKGKQAEQLWEKLIKYGKIKPMIRPVESEEEVKLEWVFPPECDVNPTRDVACDFFLFFARSIPTPTLKSGPKAKQNPDDNFRAVVFRICRCEWCRTWFSRPEKGRGKTKIYCSRSCKSAAKMRVYRARLKRRRTESK